MPPKVAIIVPIFNVEKFVSQAIISCFRQSYENLLIILVDDGSSDGSGDIAFSHFLSDMRCVLIKKPNGGQGSARNAGLDFLFSIESGADFVESSTDFKTDSNGLNLSEKIIIDSNKLQNMKLYNIKNTKSKQFYMQKGYYIYKGCFDSTRQEDEPIKLNVPQEIYVFSHLDSIESNQDTQHCEYFHFLDSDDELEYDCIESCIATLNENLSSDKNKNKNIAIWHNFSNINENGNVILDNVIGRFTEFHKFQILQNTQLLDFKARNMISICWSALFPLDSIKTHRIRFMDYVHSEDQLFSFMILCEIRSVIFTPKSLYRYRQRSDSTMNFNPQAHIAPPFLRPLYAEFSDKKLAKDYYVSYSFCAMGAALYHFTTLSDNQNMQNLLYKGVCYITPRRIKVLRCIDISGKDPKNAKILIKNLAKILPKNHFKITYLIPFYNRFLYFLRKILGKDRI